MSIKQLHKAVECSEKMLLDAVAGNWDKVFDIEAQRSVLLEKLFSSSNRENSTQGMDDKIQKIIEINQKLEAITIQARDNTRDDLRSINKGRHAVTAYAQNSYQ